MFFRRKKIDEKNVQLFTPLSFDFNFFELVPSSFEIIPTPQKKCPAPGTISSHIWAHGLLSYRNRLTPDLEGRPPPHTPGEGDILNSCCNVRFASVSTFLRDLSRMGGCSVAGTRAVLLGDAAISGGGSSPRRPCKAVLAKP